METRLRLKRLRLKKFRSIIRFQPIYSACCKNPFLTGGLTLHKTSSCIKRGTVPQFNLLLKDIAMDSNPYRKTWRAIYIL